MGNWKTSKYKDPREFYNLSNEDEDRALGFDSE
jgi:hypothetical protein